MPLVFESGRQVKENRDELATLDDARYLTWGYVAYPPVTPFIAPIAQDILFRAGLHPRHPIEGLNKNHRRKAIRQMLEHIDLPEFVGDIDGEAPYRPE